MNRVLSFLSYRICLQSITTRLKPFKWFQLMALITMLCFSCNEDNAIESTFKEVSVSNTRARYLIPYPNEITYSNDEFSLATEFCYSNANENLNPALEELDYFYKGVIERWKKRDRRLFLNKDSSCTQIHFILDQELDSESYKLDITDDITIRYNQDIGAFYALQTLKQIIRNSAYSTLAHHLVISKIKIKDQPKFLYRGIHLDVARHFYPIKDIKRFIKMLSNYKINSFNWHLSDDQGWRIEIKKYPKLQSIASRRSRTQIQSKPLKYDNKVHSGYYTQSQIKTIVKYAKEHFIQIIPEIDLLGHNGAMIAAYPELSCSGTKIPVASKWGDSQYTLCPTDTSFGFIKGVLKEVIQLFPDQYINVGGRDYSSNGWSYNDESRQTMKENNFDDPDQLYAHFIHKIKRYLENNNRNIVAWQGMMKHNIQGKTRMLLNDNIDKLNNISNDQEFIMTPSEYCNLSIYQSLDSSEPLANKGLLTLKKVFNFNPINNNISDEMKKQVIGIQGNIWTENMKDFSAVSYMAFPRLLAIAENGWTKNENQNWHRFANSIDKHIPFIRLNRFNYSRAYYEPQYETSNHDGLVFLSLNQSMDAGYIKYWSTRSNSERLSQIYQEPILLTEETNLRLKYFSDVQKFATLNTYIKFQSHLASGRDIYLKRNASDSFKIDKKMNVLINGIEGDQLNLKYNQECKSISSNTELLIDLKDTITAQNLRFTLIKNEATNEQLPLKIQIKYGLSNTELVSLNSTSIDKKRLSNSMTYNIDVSDKSLKYISIKLSSQNENKESYFYIGEIVLK